MTNEFLHERSRGLEEAFFARADRELLARLRAVRTAHEQKAVLREATGIADDDVLTHLLDLGLSAETIAAVALVPLVQVAWADGRLDRREREVVLTSARESSGLAAGSLAYRLLEGWLDERPDPRLFEAWQGSVHALAESMADETRQRFRADLLQRVRLVAQAAGGLLGLGRISQAERDAVSSIEQALP